MTTQQGKPCCEKCKGGHPRGDHADDITDGAPCYCACVDCPCHAQPAQEGGWGIKQLFDTAENLVVANEGNIPRPMRIQNTIDVLRVARLSLLEEVKAKILEKAFNSFAGDKITQLDDVLSILTNAKGQ